jgi:hypothetical protein
VVLTGPSISRRFRNLGSVFTLLPLSSLPTPILPRPLPRPLPLAPLNGVLTSLGSIIEFRSNSSSESVSFPSSLIGAVNSAP